MFVLFRCRCVCERKNGSQPYKLEIGKKRREKKHRQKRDTDINTFWFIFTRARASPQLRMMSMDAVVKMLKMSFLIQIKSGSLLLFFFSSHLYIRCNVFFFCENQKNERMKELAREFVHLQRKSLFWRTFDYCEQRCYCMLTQHTTDLFLYRIISCFRLLFFVVVAIFIIYTIDLKLRDAAKSASTATAANTLTS